MMFLGQKDMSRLCLNINVLLTQKVHAFERLRLCLEQKAKLLLNPVAMSNFSYCPLVWLFFSKDVNN